MDLSKYVPPNFEVGDLVQLVDNKYWDADHIGVFSVILEVDWRTETMYVSSPYYPRVTGLFNKFKLIGKNSRLVKLLL